MGIKISTYEFREETNVQTIADGENTVLFNLFLNLRPEWWVVRAVYGNEMDSGCENSSPRLSSEIFLLSLRLPDQPSGHSWDTLSEVRPKTR